MKHISVPRPFESGNIIEWLNRFDFCAKANGWDAAMKVVKLLTLLEDKAQAVWLDLTEVQAFCQEYLVNLTLIATKANSTDFASLL